MKKILLTVLSLGSLVVSGSVVTAANAAAVPPTTNHIVKTAGQHFGPQNRGSMFASSELATLFNMTQADLQAQLKAGKTLQQIAQDHNITQDQLNQFYQAQQQKMLDSMKQKLAQEVTSGKITQAQMDQRLATLTQKPQPGVKPVTKFGQRPMMQGNSKLAALFNMTPADLATALKSGKTIAQVAADHGVTQAQLDQFNATQKQTMLDNLKQQLSQEVTSGKITQAQMDQRLANMTSNKVRPAFGNQMHRRGKPTSTATAK